MASATAVPNSLELPVNADDETEIEPGVLDTLHKDIYYIDGCT